MSIRGDGGFNENVVSWLGLVLLQEGLDATRVLRKLTDGEEVLEAVLEELSFRKLSKIYPEIEKRRPPTAFSAAPSGELWSRASELAQNGVDPLQLLYRRDDQHPRGGCRFCAAKAAVQT